MFAVSLKQIVVEFHSRTKRFSSYAEVFLSATIFFVQEGYHVAILRPIFIQIYGRGSHHASKAGEERGQQRYSTLKKCKPATLGAGSEIAISFV
jgi:hypothetical protein